MAGSDSQPHALSVSGAGVRGVVGRRGSVAARAVDVGYVLNRAQRHFDSDDALGAIGAPSHSGNAGGSIRRGSFGGPCADSIRERGHAAPSRGTADEVPVSFAGFHHRWRHGAPLGGLFERRIHSRASQSANRSLDRPSNTQMEPSRPNVLCDPVTAARGSFATLGGPTFEGQA